MSPVLRRALSGLKPLSVSTVQPSLRAAAHRSKDVRRLSRGADRHQHVAGSAMEFDLLGEHLLVAVVVGQAGQHAAVVHRPGSQAAVLAVVGRHVAGDSGAAAVAGEDDLVALSGDPARGLDRPFDGGIQSDFLAMGIRRDGASASPTPARRHSSRSTLRASLLPHEALPGGCGYNP